MATRMVPGDKAIYIGQGQLSLDQGDVVTIDSDLGKAGYRVKPGNTGVVVNYHYCTDDQLSFMPGLTSGQRATNFDNATSISYTNSVSEQRKEEGKCVSCGSLLPMSSFGLLPCPCTPQEPVKW